MAKEMEKNTAEVTANAAAESATETVTKVEGNRVFSGLTIIREPYKRKDGTMTKVHLIKGMLRGKEMIARIAPTGEGGGYDVLNDVVFADSNTASLMLIPYAMRNEITKKVQRGFTYEAQNVDADGRVYRMKIKPKQDSDKYLIDMWLEGVQIEDIVL